MCLAFYMIFYMCYWSHITWNTEKAMAPHSSTLARKIPWMEEPGGLQSMGSLRVGHDWATSLSLSLSCIGEGNSNPLQCSCLENPKDGGAWWAAVYGVAQSQTRLKWLSSSSSNLKQCYSVKRWGEREGLELLELSGKGQIHIYKLWTNWDSRSQILKW